MVKIPRDPNHKLNHHRKAGPHGGARKPDHIEDYKIRNYRSMTMTNEEVRDRVIYHAPSPEGVKRHAALSGEFENMIHVILAIVPPGREQSIVITKLEEAKFWASAAVARNPETR